MLSLSSISDNCNYTLLKCRAPEKSFKFPPKVFIETKKLNKKMLRICVRESFCEWITFSSLRIIFSVIGSKANISITQQYRDWEDASEKYHKDSMKN